MVPITILARARTPGDLRRRDRPPRSPGGPARGALPAAGRGSRAAAPRTCSAPDHVGRDVLSRLIFGARVSMVVGFTAVIFAGVVGTVLGILAGYLGGWVDQVIMRVTDAWLALPCVDVSRSFLAAIVGPSEHEHPSSSSASSTGRATRGWCAGEVLLAQERELRASGHRGRLLQRTIMRRHILPNVVNSAIVLATLMLGVVIVTEAALSVSGASACRRPSRRGGLMLADGKKGLMAGYWWPHGAARRLHHADGALRPTCSRLVRREAGSAAPQL